LTKVQEIGEHMEMVLKDVPGTSSVFAERTAGGYFLDFDIKRKEIGRYGLSVAQVEMSITSAIGGENISTTIEGRERYPINVRYFQDFRSAVDRLGRVLVPTPAGQHNPMPIGRHKVVSGPGMIRDENGRLSDMFTSMLPTRCWKLCGRGQKSCLQAG